MILCRLYYTKVKLGSPPKEFNVQIDTGSDILWVTCNSCSDCPQSSTLGVSFCLFNFFPFWVIVIGWIERQFHPNTFFFICCRFSSISSILPVHQVLHQCTAQIQCALPQPLYALLRVINVVTYFNMEMEVAHRVIMCLMQCILTWSLGSLWLLTLRQQFFLGKLPWLKQKWCVCT